MKFIPYGKQFIDEEDKEAVLKALGEPFITTGPIIEQFEKEICHTTGAKYAVAMANGTAALHVASLALLKPGDKVLTTPNSFVATSNGILLAGAVPIFIDITSDGNIDFDLCEKNLEKAPEIKALYPVHFSGRMVDQDKLDHLRTKFKLKVLEDCAHSLGAEYQGIKGGESRNSDCSILSFHPVKHITTGEGGAITTNDKKLYDKFIQLRSHGITKVPELLIEKELAYDHKGNLNPWYYEMQYLTTNYRITDIQGALGISQLKKLSRFIERRIEIAKKYDSAFKNHPIICPLYEYDDKSSYHLYVIRIDFSKLSITKAELFQILNERKIGPQVHYIPIYSQPYYKKFGIRAENFPVMEKYYEQALSIPLYPSLKDSEQDYVIEQLNEIINRHLK